MCMWGKMGFGGYQEYMSSIYPCRRKTPYIITNIYFLIRYYIFIKNHNEIGLIYNPNYGVGGFNPARCAKERRD